jgi:nicotinamide-nucleotide amidase
MIRSVSILATGSELLDGRVVDTNSNFVAKELSERGLALKRILVVDDDLHELVGGLGELSKVSDFIITSGGLGPTSDDLTRDAVSKFFGVGLSEHPDGRKHLEQFFAKRGRPLDPTNLKQALLPVGARMVPNENGTAPGFLCSKEGLATVVSLSGVPREFKAMFLGTVLPIIEREAAGVQKIERRAFKTFGLPESLIGRLVEGLKLPQEVVVSYRAAFPEVHVVLKAPQGFDLNTSAGQVREAIGPECVYTEVADETFVAMIHRHLLERGATVATAESCTGGMVSEMLTRTPGSSASFVGGIVAYSDSVKANVVGVADKTLKANGAVSAETVRELAAEARERLQATIGVSISGIAGPDGGSAEKPVGTFFVGISSPFLTRELRCLYMSERHNIRTYASYVALDLIRRALTGLPAPATYPIAK